MHKSLRVVLLLWLALLLIVGSAVLISRGPVQPDRLARWHLTDCAPPCWMGIVPGETPVSVARQRIASVLSLPPYKIKDVTPANVADLDAVIQLIDPANAQPSPTIEIMGEGRVVQGVYAAGITYRITVSAGLGANTDMPSLAEVFNAFGAPAAVMPLGGGMSELLYADATCTTVLHIGVNGPFSKSWDQPIAFFRVIDTTDVMNQEACDPTIIRTTWTNYWTLADGPITFP